MIVGGLSATRGIFETWEFFRKASEEDHCSRTWAAGISGDEALNMKGDGEADLPSATCGVDLRKF